MPTTRSQATRGAVAGVVAAGVWALQQPLDQKLFGVRYDDTELLGKLVTRGSAWPAAGAAIHLLNGAAFGAAYSQLATCSSRPTAGPRAQPGSGSRGATCE